MEGNCVSFTHNPVASAGLFSSTIGTFFTMTSLNIAAPLCKVILTQITTAEF